MKTIKIIFWACMVMLMYANAVVPVKKPKQNKCIHSPGRLKTVFCGKGQ